MVKFIYCFFLYFIALDHVIHLENVEVKLMLPNLQAFLSHYTSNQGQFRTRRLMFGVPNTGVEVETSHLSYLISLQDNTIRNSQEGRHF